MASENGAFGAVFGVLLHRTPHSRGPRRFKLVLASWPSLDGFEPPQRMLVPSILPSTQKTLLTRDLSTERCIQLG
jgi:hypothetical protein